MTKRLIPLFLALAALVLAACGDDSGDNGDDTGNQTFDQAALAQPIEVDAGSTFEVVLDANNTTPYGWVITRKPDSEVVTLQDRGYVSDANPEGMSGVGGEERFTFEAVAAGTTEITLDYEELSGEGSAEKVTANVTVR